VSDFLLATKIRIPFLHCKLVNRPYLIHRLNDEIFQNCRLTLISAPAGYGKSTLLSEWVSQLNIPAAWLTLEQRENNPARFWNYFYTALSTIPHLRQAKEADDLFQSLRSPQPLPVDALLASLVNMTSNLEKGAVLVLDDLHTITEGQIHQDLIFLVDHLPLSASSLHIVVASRADPPWPLARWRALGQLVEVRTTDLRFNPEEATEYLNRTMLLELSSENVRALENRTEGWIAGLQMAALALQSLAKQDTLLLQGREDVQKFIRAFSGSNRYIFDYLMDEILSRQEPEMQEFLLKTSILERLSAPLCNAILGRSNSQLFLDRIEKSNLFLVPLDRERTWYRYHLLFADLLASSLKQSQPEALPELHRKACAWYEANGLLSEALVHAFAAGDLDRLVKIVERYAFTIMEVHEASSLLNWLNSLPESIMVSKPWLNIARAWLLAYLGRSDQIEPAIGDAEKYADPRDQRLKGYIAAMQALSGEIGSRPYQNGFVQGMSALALLPQDEFRPRGFVCYHLANILSWQGEIAAALKMLEDAIEMSQCAGDIEMAMTAQFEIASLLRHQGKLKESSRMFERTHQMANTHLPERKSLSVGFAYLQQALIFLEWNEVDQALQFAREGTRLCSIWGYCDYLYNGWYYYAGILLETGNLDGALYAIREAIHAFSENYPGDRVMALEAVINQARGDEISTAAWLSSCGMSPADVPDFANRFGYFLFAQVLEGQGKLEEAYRILEGLDVAVGKVGENNLLIKILTREAVIAYTIGDVERALTLLERALHLAEPEGYSRVFIDKGKKMEQLLRRAVTAGISPVFARTLLELCAESTTTEPGKKDRSASVDHRRKIQPLSEPLSERELEVLHLLNTSLDTTEIARELMISVSTVRTHVKNIYNKLNVNRRMQAVERANDLKLL
jgi:LuxR family maltose regulon positive regulatory protein